MAGAREKLLTASDLAALCEVDLKTIHNWVDRGRIPHFRTPGRHLRFRAADAADFLRTWGYAVPRELAKSGARSGLLIGSYETFAHLGRALGEAAPTRVAPHPYDALILAGAEAPDVYLVDPRVAAANVDIGAVLEALRRATPQAVFVAFADDAGQELPPFVQRVSRSDVAALRAALGVLPVVPANQQAAADGPATTPARAANDDR